MKTLEKLPNLNRAIAIVSHPFIPLSNGSRDLFIRPKDAPKTSFAPLFNHHEGEPIGEVKLEYTKICEINATHDLFIVCGLLSSQAPLLPNQAVSMSAGLINTIGRNNIFEEVVEVSLVDTPHVNGCAIFDLSEYANVFKALYTHAPSIVEQILKELNAKT